MIMKQIACSTRGKLKIFDFNQMNIDNTSLTSLNQEFKEYENINVDFDIDVLDFWRQHEKKSLYSFSFKSVLVKKF